MMELKYDELAEYNELKKMCQQMELLRNLPELRRNGIVFGNSFRIEFSTLPDLRAGIKWALEHLEARKYTLSHRFYSVGKACTVWKSEHVDLALWLVCPVEDYPDELQSDDYRWVASDTTSTREYAFVCKQGE